MYVVLEEECFGGLFYQYVQVIQGMCCIVFGGLVVEGSWFFGIYYVVVDGMFGFDYVLCQWWYVVGKIG